MSTYSLQKIEDREAWDNFVALQPDYTFLQSYAYGAMQEKLGARTWRFGVWREGTLCGVMLVIKIHARRGDFLFVPHGPILSQSPPCTTSGAWRPEPDVVQGKIYETLIATLKRIALEEKASFIRISSLLEDSEENKKLFQGFGFRDAPIHMHPETTWTLDIQKSEQGLLGDMRKTTRNLIRRAEREGVEIRIGTSSQDFEDFYNLYKQTAAKQHFVPFSRAYLLAELEVFEEKIPAAVLAGSPAKTAAESGAAIVLGMHNGKVQAGAFVVFYGDSGFYHHGASALEDQKIPVPYLVQWAAIQEAKKRGNKFYNFWGIVPQENSSHPWAGLSLFKMGFGGFRTDYLHAQDLPLSWMYWINWVVETMRRMKRRY